MCSFALFGNYRVPVLSKYLLLEGLESYLGFFIFGKEKIGKGTYPTLFIPVWIAIVSMPIRILPQVLHMSEIHRIFFTFIHSFSFLASVILVTINNNFQYCG
jgi:hypothetical protein